MRQRVIVLLMAVTTLSWLATNECKAQKLTEVSASFGDGDYYSNWYWDVNGDGKLEHLIRTGWIDANGNIIKQIQDVGGSLMDDLNGDGIVDFVGQTLYLSNGTNYEKVVTGIDSDAFVSPCVVDINHDGLKDIFFYFYDSNIGKYIPSSFIQTDSHRFFYEELCVVTDKVELENIQFSSGDNGIAFTVPTGQIGSLSFAEGMFAESREISLDTSEAGARRVSPLGEEEYSDIAVVDINNDGFPDIISTKYPTLLSLPDGRYYAGSLTGKVAIADINSDGLKDIVHFNTTTNTVTLYLSQDGEDYLEKKLIDNGSITGMYCQDFDGDGLTDIMLQAASESYSFIVFFINKGNGEFTKKENMLTGEYVFSKPYDFNNDGKASVLAAGFSNHRYNFIPELKLLTWDSNLTLSEEGVTYNGSQLYSTGSWDYYWKSWKIPPFKVADFDGDGVLEVMCRNNTYYYGSYSYYIYSPFSPSANTAPQQMTTPNVVYDRQSGYVKVEWQQGSDNETASSDLTYTVRMGTADGGQDLMVYDAGVSRYCVAKTGTWEQGTVYVSVRATDANGKSGDWSPSATFEVVTQSAEFTLHNKDLNAECFTTTDTLVVRSLNGKSLTYQLPDDGKIILQKGDSAYITFSNYGKKTIVASIEDGQDVTHSIEVHPIRLIEPTSEYQNYNKISINALYGFDLNTNGYTEGVNGNLWTFKGGVFTPLGTLFNSDITVISSPVFIDKTMNGLPDIFSKLIIKNNVQYNWLVNRGDLDFEVEQGDIDDDSYMGKFLDLNNDGFMDYIGAGGGVFINQGGNTFSKIGDIYNALCEDVDRDGHIELVTRYSNKIQVYKLSSDVSLEMVSETNLDKTSDLKYFFDYNNDGYPDIFAYGNKVYVNNKNMEFKEKAVLPGFPIKPDIDNNAYIDYAPEEREEHYAGAIYMGKQDGSFQTFHSVDLIGGNSHTNLLTYYETMTDLNNDGRPDTRGNKTRSTERIIQSAFTNEAPTAPTSVSVTQDDDYVVVSWSGATDKETPNMALRYNLSVKEKGATGDGSYIISPLNMTRDEAKTIDAGTMQYRYATRFPIPFSRFTVGKTYEVQVQTIDGWCEHSPFSTVVEFTPTAQTLLKMPEKAGEGQWVTFSLKDNSGGTPVIDTDGGVMDGNAISWSTPGIKTVKATVNGVTTSRQIQIIAYPYLSFYMPKKVLAGSVVNVELPTDFWRSDATVKLVGSDGITCTIEDNKGIVVMPQRAGNYEVQIVSEDDVFGKVVYTKKVEVIDFKPEISRVSATSDGSLIQWDSNMSSEVNEMLTGKVKVYRETAVTGRYEVVGEANMTDGQFADNTSRPDIKSCRYMITLPTVYGTESQESEVHGTVLLMANQGLGYNINLHWNHYEGAQVATYTIYAGTSRDNLQVVDEVSGNTLSYVHHRTSDEPTFYAIGYTLMSELSNASRHAASADQQARSNIICSDEAYNVTMVQNISIETIEESHVLNSEQPILHLKAIVTPALATLARVEWSITAGNDLAEIDKNGVLTIKENETGGTVTVQARAIDGSEVFSTVNISVEPYNTTGVHVISNTKGNPVIRIADSGIYVENIQDATDVTVLTMSGAVTYRNRITSDRHILLQSGIYIVKAGQLVKKIAIR